MRLGQGMLGGADSGGHCQSLSLQPQPSVLSFGPRSPTEGALLPRVHRVGWAARPAASSCGPALCGQGNWLWPRGVAQVAWGLRAQVPDQPLRRSLYLPEPQFPHL